MVSLSGRSVCPAPWRIQVRPRAGFAVGSQGNGRSRLGLSGACLGGGWGNFVKHVMGEEHRPGLPIHCLFQQ